MKYTLRYILRHVKKTEHNVRPAAQMLAYGTEIWEELAHLSRADGVQRILVKVLEPHQERHGGVEEVVQRVRQNGDVHVLPLERQQQARHALRHQHQLLVVCNPSTGTMLVLPECHNFKLE